MTTIVSLFWANAGKVVQIKAEAREIRKFFTDKFSLVHGILKNLVEI